MLTVFSIIKINYVYVVIVMAHADPHTFFAILEGDAICLVSFPVRADNGSDVVFSVVLVDDLASLCSSPAQVDVLVFLLPFPVQRIDEIFFVDLADVLASPSSFA